jgi:hypothetical protein
MPSFDCPVSHKNRLRVITDWHALATVTLTASWMSMSANERLQILFWLTSSFVLSGIRKSVPRIGMLHRIKTSKLPEPRQL